MAAYFNEHEPYAAAWLRNLYPDATVDERSIHEVQAADLVGHDRVHLFGGIGGWEHALDLAGWSGPTWTGSCPCQPFSAAGKRQGEADERHLWPEMFRLVRECRPAIIVGEQVASGDALRWLDGIFADLEGAGYACGAADLCSAGVGSPNIRQRLFWVAYAIDGLRSGNESESCNSTDGLAHAGPSSPRHGCRSNSEDAAQRSEAAIELAGRGDVGGVEHPDTRGLGAGSEQSIRQPSEGCELDWMGDTDGPSHRFWKQRLRPLYRDGARSASVEKRAPWIDYRIIQCRDGKFRRISAQRSDEPLAPRIPREVGPLLAELERLGHDSKAARRIIRDARRNRNGRLKGYGNAINPHVAAVFVRAVMEVLGAK